MSYRLAFLQALKASWRRIRALCFKEFLAMWADPGTRKILIVPILVQSLVFGYGATFNLSHIPFVVSDESRTPLSLRFIEGLQGSTYFTLQGYYVNSAVANAALNDSEGVFALYFPPDFATTGELYFAGDGRNSTSAATALSYLNEYVTLFNRTAARPVTLSYADTYRIPGYRYLFNEQNITRHSILTGMIMALSLIQVLMLSAMTVAREREEGTFDMLLMTPATPPEILVGKALPPITVAVGQSLLLFLICISYFEIPFQGSFLTLTAVIAVFSFCYVGVGLAISVLARSAQQALVISFLIMLPSIILSGLLTPLEAMPPGIGEAVRYLNPLCYGIEALHRVYLEGQTFGEIAFLLVPQLLIAVLSLALTMRLFRKAL